MPSMKFTKRNIEGLRPRDTRYEVFEKDGNGFGVRITPKGTKTWFYSYRLKKKLHRMTIGSVEDKTLADARSEAATARKLVAKGRNPKDSGKTIVTVRDLVGFYLEKWAKERKRSWEEDKRILDREVLPQWGDLLLHEVTRDMVDDLVQAVADRGAPIGANRVLAVIRKMFNFAITKGHVGDNPCRLVPAPTRESRRERYLSEDEIKKFWQGLESSKMTPRIRMALKLILTTAQRKGEVVNAEWKEIDLDASVWTIPSEKAKNGQAHRVPLSPLASEMLGHLKAMAGASRWVLPSPHGDSPVTTNAINRALTRETVRLGMEHFTPHDLRRTAVTHIAGLKTEYRLILKKILNHKEYDVTDGYNLHAYDKEKREALDAWAKHIEKLISCESE